MVRIKLLKGLSYSGVVSATKKSPYVTTDEDTAKEAVATGYFGYVPEAVSTSSTDTTAENTAEDQEENDLPPATEDKVQKPIEKMTKPELEAYAEANGIDISSCTNNEQRIALIKEIENKKDDNMVPDFSQE
jgi:hypothetical protein